MKQWFIALCLMPVVALGVGAPLTSVEQQRYDRLIHEVRCVTCPNQSIAESNTPEAHSLKREIEEKIRNGQDADLIKAQLVERYGQRIDYKPPFQLSTLVLWVLPLLMVLALSIINIRKLRKR